MLHSQKPAAWIYLLCLALCAVPQGKSQVSGGTIEGLISDPSGAVIPNAAVVVFSTTGGEPRRTVTNATGFYTVPNLVPGTYRLTATAKGFAEQTLRNLVLTVGAVEEINLALATEGVTEKVEVQGTASSVDLSTSTVSAAVGGQVVRDLPLNGRDWTMLATLQPGVTTVATQPAQSIGSQRSNRGLGTQLVVNGNRPQQNNYRLDGISINDYSNGGPGSVLALNLGVDAIQEFSVITNNASAEYGKTAGGVINAASRSGSNTLHGAAYDFLRNSAMDARNFFDPASVAPFRRNQFGGAVGGRIRKERDFFFTDYEGIRQSLGVSFVTNVPSAGARSGNLTSGRVTVDPAVAPFLALFPLPNAGSNGDIGVFSFAGQQTTREDFVTGRLDHYFSSNDRIFGTYMFDDGITTSPDAFDLKRTAALSRRQMTMFEETHTFSSSFLNSFRAGFSRVWSKSPTNLNSIRPVSDDKSLGFIPGLTAGYVTIPGLTQFTGGTGAVGEFDFVYNSYQVYDDAFWTVGQHAIKLGFAFERMQNNQRGGAVPNGSFNFGSLAGFLTNKPSSFTSPLNGTLQPIDLRQSVVGGYIQDDWRATRRLTLNLGLRYEMATVPTEASNHLAVLANIADAQPRIGSPFFSNPTLRDFAPRIGLSWDPFGDGKTAIRPAFGMYDVLPLDYEVAILSLLTAPYFESGSVTSLPAGSFPTGAFNLLKAAPRLRYSYVEQNPKRNYVMEWNFNVQRRLTKDVTLEAAYSGTRGVRQPFRVDDINYVIPQATPAGYFWPTPIGSGITANPNPGVGQVSALFWEASSIYHGMHVQVQKKMAHGLQVQGTYTWSKSIDTGSASVAGDTFANGLVSLPYYNTKLARGLSDFDVRHVAAINYLWQTPAPHLSGLGGFLLGGWQFGGIISVQSGPPFSAMIGGDPVGSRINISDPVFFADRLSTPGCSSPVNPGNPSHYIKTQCFAFPNPVVRLGDSGRNTLNGPGLFDFDTSLVKNTPIRHISESFVVQFRAEAFNILNRANFAPPPKANIQMFNASGTALPTAGVLASTVTPSRQLQLALKLIW